MAMNNRMDQNSRSGKISVASNMLLLMLGLGLSLGAIFGTKYNNVLLGIILGGVASVSICGIGFVLVDFVERKVNSFATKKEQREEDTNE